MDAIQNFTLNVLDQSAPTFITSNQTTFTVGTPGSFTVTSTGAPTPTLSHSSGSISGLTYTPGPTKNTGVISGTPATGQGGIHTFAFSASNGVGTTATQTLTISVAQAPAITPMASQTFIVGAAKTVTIKTTGYPIPTISESGALPSGIMLVDNKDGTATLSGTAAPGSGGNYTLSMTADNMIGAPATSTLMLTVDERAAITSGGSATFAVGTSIPFTVTATGFPTPTLLRSGTLPTGVTFVDNHNGSGTLSGTPAVGSGRSYSITLTATSSGTPATPPQNFSLIVNEVPAITSAAASTFTVGTTKLFTVKTRGYPFPAITASIALPSGLTLTDNHDGSATLSGTAAPGTGGTYKFVLNASNGFGPDASQAFTLTINQAPAITSPNAVTFRVGAANSFSITTTGFPAPSIPRPAALPASFSFKNNGNGTATISSSTGKNAPPAGTYAFTVTAQNSTGTTSQAFVLTVQ